MYKIQGKDIVISGWEKGIADSPYQGIGDIRNANISSVPGEASVNFSTVSAYPASLQNVTISSADPATNNLTITSSPTLDSGMAILISGTNLPNPLTAGTSTAGAFYWVNKINNTTIQLYSTYAAYLTSGSVVDITTAGTPGDWTFSTIDVNVPKYFANDSALATWMVDQLGRVWRTSGQGTNFTYTGNKIPNSSSTSGNGIVFYSASDGTGYIFVIHNSSIDVTLSAAASISWNYQWDPSAGAYGSYAATPTKVLKTAVGSGVPHEAIVTPANQVVFTDTQWVDRFYQTSPGTAFVPTTASTYTWDQTNLLPITDVAQCITFLGQNILIGGQLNVIYPWDGISTKFLYPIFLSEYFISKMVTVKTNAFIFAGVRGRIHVTNGTNADVYKKIPDYISGTVEPYFTWGGACAQKNRIYFGFKVTANNGSTNLTSNYKGIWSIDVDNGALVGTNQLSPGTAVYGNAITALPTINSLLLPNIPSGAGLFIGWTGASNGIDTTSTIPYSNLETYIETDMIPVGTYLKPFSPSQVEWKTSYPIGVNGTAETIQVQYRTAVGQSYTSIGSTTVTGATMVGTTTGTTTVATASSTGANPLAVSDYYQVNFQKAQWVQLKVLMSSNATTPTYNRLTEVRIRDYPA